MSPRVCRDDQDLGREAGRSLETVSGANFGLSLALLKGGIWGICLESELFANRSLEYGCSWRIVGALCHDARCMGESEKHIGGTAYICDIHVPPQLCYSCETLGAL